MHETPRGRTASNGAGQVSRRGLLVGSGLVLGGAATGVLSPARARAGTGSSPDGAGTTAGTEVPAVEVRPGDPRYPALTTGYNQRFSGTPAYVAVVTTPVQCLAAVREAVAAGRRVTVRGGGHCYEGVVSDNPRGAGIHPSRVRAGRPGPGGAVIDLSGMRAVAQDQDGGGALQAGCPNWDVYELLYKSYGVTLPGGSCYSVGLGGHVVGGGYGLMSREHGLTVHYLDAVDVIVVDAHCRVHVVTARKGDPDTGDLFWAHTGGGGGTFGVITAYHFKDAPVPPPVVQLASTTWEWSALDPVAFATLVGNYGRYLAANSAPGSPARTLF